MFDASRTVHAVLDFMARWLPEEPAARKRLGDIADSDADIAYSDEDLDAHGSVEQAPVSTGPVSGIQVTASAASSRKRAAS